MRFRFWRSALIVSRALTLPSSSLICSVRPFFSINQIFYFWAWVSCSFWIAGKVHEGTKERQSSYIFLPAACFESYNSLFWLLSSKFENEEISTLLRSWARHPFCRWQCATEVEVFKYREWDYLSRRLTEVEKGLTIIEKKHHAFEKKFNLHVCIVAT